MRQPLVAGNWKMHGNLESIDQLLKGILSSGLPSSVEIAVFPPYVYLPHVKAILARSNVINVGAQNVSEHREGAYTGEVSGTMLKELGCKYTLVGHSERRTLFGETNQQVAEKFITAQKLGLIPVLCVGETQEQREARQTEQVIASQLAAVTQVVDEAALTNAVIAYEPIWAIGTGLTATPEQAQQVHGFIRQRLGGVASQIRVVYGGSVKAANAQALFKQTDIDGALVGGASLDSQEFSAICQMADIA